MRSVYQSVMSPPPALVCPQAMSPLVPDATKNSGTA
jgi:hypothetical protein